MGLFIKKPEYVYTGLKFSERLPIGSVVTLNDFSKIEQNNPGFMQEINKAVFHTKKFIIVGYNSYYVSKQNGHKQFVVCDYDCVQYPLGNFPEGRTICG